MSQGTISRRQAGRAVTRLIEAHAAAQGISPENVERLSKLPRSVRREAVRRHFCQAGPSLTVKARLYAAGRLSCER